MAIHTLENSKLKVIINEMGGVIDAFTYRGEQPFEILRPRIKDGSNFAGNSGLFPMLPVVNRIRNNQFYWQGRHIVLPIHDGIDQEYFLHGDGWLTQWEYNIETNETGAQPLILTTKSKISGVCDYTAEQKYTLEDDRLILTLSLRNTGQEVFPFGIGFHPFFHCLPETLVKFHAQGMWFEDIHYLPTNYVRQIPELFSFTEEKLIPSMWINNGFHLSEDGINIKLNHQNGLTVSIMSSCRYLQVYKPEGLTNFLCLEPQSQHVDAHNSPHYDSLTILEPQESMVITMSIIVQES